MPLQDQVGGLKAIIRVLPKKRRIDFALLTLGMAVAAALESILLATIMSATQYLTSGSPGEGAISQLALTFADEDPQTAATIIIAILLCTVLLTTAARIGLLKGTASLAYSAGRDISMELLSRSLQAKIPYFAGAGSAALIASINRVQILSHTVLLPILRSIGAVFLSITIMATIFMADALTALLATGVIGGTYFITTLLLKPKLKRNGVTISEAQESRISALRESIGSIREIKLYGNSSVFESAFEKEEHNFRSAQAENLYYSQFPRYVVEAAGLILLSLLVYASAYDVRFVSTSLPAIGALAIGAQRLLPLVQQVFNGWAQFSGNSGVVSDISQALALLDHHREERDDLKAAEPKDWSCLIFDGVEYKHDEKNVLTLKKADFVINRGESIVLTGATGSGKSTLIDLIMGFRRPTGGEIRLDDEVLYGDLERYWKRQIALVPQSTFMLNGTIRENITFGTDSPQIDDDAINKVLYQTDLLETIDGLPEGLSTQVGEDGIRLSGGQRQRVAFARALLKKRPVLVLDEATSALDAETEHKVLARVSRENPDLTIIHISHRINSSTDNSKELHIAGGIVQIRSKELVRSAGSGP